MKVTGQILRKNRESKNLSLREVSTALKINIKVLKSIEEGETESLPAKTFVRGFVRSYAKYLKLNVDDIMNTFYEEMGSTQPVSDADSDSEELSFEAGGRSKIWPVSLPFLKNQSNSIRYIILGSIVVLIFIIIFVKNTVDKYEKERVKLSKQEIAETTGVNSSAIDETKKLKEDPEKKEVIKKELSIKEEIKTTEMKTAKPDENKTEVKAPEIEKKSEEIKKEKVKIKKIPSGPQEVIVEALDHVEVTFYVDGGAKKTLTLRPDQIHTFRARSKLKIYVSDAGAINIVHNGRDKGVPGNIGEEKTLNFK